MLKRRILHQPTSITLPQFLDTRSLVGISASARNYKLPELKKAIKLCRTLDIPDCDWLHIESYKAMLP
jgi:hypothetical protein